MLRYAHILLILLLATTVAVPPHTTGQPAATMQPAEVRFFGMNTYFTALERLSRDGETGVAALIGRGRQIGTTWAREELSWGNLERHGKGRWEWPLFDRRLLAIAQAGYGIVGMLLTTPAWARAADCSARLVRYPGIRVEPYWCPPARPQDFADYVSAVVERYDGDGYNDAPGSPRVAVWQIWNEPNHWETWPGSPAEYAAILQAGYAAVKAADPSATVAVGGLYVLDSAWSDGPHQDGLRFFDHVLMASPAAWHSFDVLAIHPYMPDVAPDQPGLYGAVTLWGRIATTRSWLEERTRLLGGRPRPIWISELGWSTCTAADPYCYVGAGAIGLLTSAQQPVPVFLGPTALAAYSADEAPLPFTPTNAAAQAELAQILIGKTEQQQADYLVRAHGIALAQGVQHLSWFQLEDKFDGAARNFWQEAAIIRPAAFGYAPKPAAFAYAAMVSQLGAARFEGFGPLHTFVHQPTANAEAARFHLRFRTADNYLVDLLWRNEGFENVVLPLEPGVATAEALTRDGAPIPDAVREGAAFLVLGESPVYLRQRFTPTLDVTPSQIAVFARPTDPPTPVRLTLRNLGSGSIAWTAAVDAPWVRLETSSGQGFTGELRLTLDQTGLALGDHRATLRINSEGGAREIPIRLLVSDRLVRHYAPFVGR